MSLCLGLGKADLMREHDEQMRLKYFDPIENFPDKIDQLLEALDRVRLTEYSYQVSSCHVFRYI